MGCGVPVFDHWLYWAFTLPPMRYKLRRQVSPGLGGTFGAVSTKEPKGMAISVTKRRSSSASSLRVPSICVAVASCDV